MLHGKRVFITAARAYARPGELLAGDNAVATFDNTADAARFILGRGAGRIAAFAAT